MNTFFSYNALGKFVQTIVILLAIFHGQQITHHPFLFRYILILLCITTITSIFTWTLHHQDPRPLHRLYRGLLELVARYTGVLAVLCTNKWVGDYLTQAPWTVATPFRYLPLFFIILNLKEVYLELYYSNPNLKSNVKSKFKESEHWRKSIYVYQINIELVLKIKA